jgi:hypothetical protein
MEIQLSKTGKNKGLYTAIVDKKDYDRVNQFNWSVFVQNGNIGVSRGVMKNKKKSTVMLGKFILQTHKAVYHKNGEKLDFRRSNLYTSNVRPKKPNCVSQYAGVSIIKNKVKKQLKSGIIKEAEYTYWFAYICVDGKTIYLGTRTTEVLAAKLYDRKALEIFGEKALLNFPNQ